MANTKNSNMKIFTNVKSAENFYNKQKSNCELLVAKMGNFTSYFVEINQNGEEETAIEMWPNSYESIAKK